MYVNNGKISSRQTFRLYVFDLMGIATLLLPPYLAKLCGADGIWAILLGTATGFLYLIYLGWIMKHMKTDLITYLREEVGGVIRMLILLCVFLHSVFTAGFCSYIFANLMQYSLVKNTDFSLVLLVIVLVAAYAVSGGIESRARVYEVLFWLVLVPYIVMMLASIRDFEFSNINELFTVEIGELWKGVYLVFLFLTPLFYSLFLIGEKEKNNGKHIVKTVGAAILVSAAILLVSYFLLVGNFGTASLEKMKYPVITLMSTIQFKGNFLKRMDALMVAVWFFTLYALLNLHLHYGVGMLSEMFMRKTQLAKKRRWTVWLAAGIVFLIGMGFGRYPDFIWIFAEYYGYAAVPFMVVVPGILLILGKKSRGVCNGEKMVE